MELNFDPVEIRILGVLMEKEMTTPEYYPLTLNALTLGCNQKSNREPIVNLTEEEVTRALDQLQLKRLAQKISMDNSRVPRYRHLFDEKFTPTRKEKTIFCLLFLRGPQTPGELRSRSGRMQGFQDLEEIKTILEDLMEKEGGPFVLLLERQTGQKEQRYAHLFCGPPVMPEAGEREITVLPYTPSADQQKLEELEKRVFSLEKEMEALKRLLEGTSKNYK